MQWVYNILDKKSEVERIIYEDPDAEQGFMVMPDMKWNEKLTEDLYVMGLVRRRGIRTLRDLTAVHLPMLKNMLAKGKVSYFLVAQCPTPTPHCQFVDIKMMILISILTVPN